MKISKFIVFLLPIFAVFGCDSKMSVIPIAKTKPTPAAVHTLKPADVSDYVENHFKLFNQMEFQFEGKQYSLTPLSIYSDQIVALIKDKSIVGEKFQGQIFIGFDFDNEKPINNFSVCLGEISGIEKDTAKDCYQKDNITLSENKNDSVTYSGTVKKSQGIFNIRLLINESLLSHGTSRIKLISSNKAELYGTLGTGSYRMFSELINNNPKVRTLLLKLAPGSINDEINMHTGRLIRNADFTTIIPNGGEASSGAVDLFSAGTTRIVESGGKAGVHSWCCTNKKQAQDLPKDHSAHGAQLSYFREMLGNDIGPEFYFFTINAAPANGIHWMTRHELTKYLITQ